MPPPPTSGSAGVPHYCTDSITAERPVVPMPYKTCKLPKWEKHKFFGLAGACTSSAQPAPKRPKRGPPMHAPHWNCQLPGWRKAQAKGPLAVALRQPTSVVLFLHQGSCGRSINLHSNL